MNFISTDLEVTLLCLDKLTWDKHPMWGKMTAQHMVEHLTDTIKMSYSSHNYPLAIPEAQIAKMQDFLFSDQPIAKNQPNPAVSEDYTPRNENLALAIDEFSEVWIAYEEYYQFHPTTKILHPIFGELDKNGWDRMHSKHFTHHFTQFELLASN